LLSEQAKVIWIGARPARDQAMIAVNEAQIVLKRGLVGDRYGKKPTSTGLRELSLISTEAIVELAKRLGFADATPLFPQTRRNIVVQGVDLKELLSKAFWLGECQLQGTGNCDPCLRMDLVFGAGGFQAMQGLGGITARVLKPGIVRVGDQLRYLD
jgi:MOSC domain-containing protein YiiM